MKFGFSRALLALLAALTFALNGSVSVLAAEKEEIAYTVEYEDGRTLLTLTPSEKGNRIYYTRDGSKPDSSSKRYRSRLATKKSGGEVIRAAEYDKNGKKVATVKVELKLRCAAPRLTAEKTAGGFLVTLSAAEGCAVYYTTDGSKPTKSSAVYGEPFFVKKGATVRAYAAKSGMKNSEAIKKTVQKATAVKTEETGIDPACEEVLGLINDYRAENGREPLVFDETLLKAAQIRAKELIESYDHTRPDGRSCFTVLDESAFSYQSAGENIAWTEGTLSTPATVTKSWIDSAPHRENILSDRFEVTGIAAVRDGNKTYWVQLFAKKW